MKSEKKEEPQASKDSVIDPKSKRQKCQVFKKEFCFESIIQSVLCTYWA